jgi:hypothetical protein
MNDLASIGAIYGLIMKPLLHRPPQLLKLLILFHLFLKTF